MFDIGRRFILTARVCMVAGLVILDARYGPAENDDDLEGLTINVTVPLQALVSKSQLYIPGRRTKVSSRAQRKHAVQSCFRSPYHRQRKSCQDLLLQCCRTLGDAARRCICACLSIFSQGQPCHNMDLGRWNMTGGFLQHLLTQVVIEGTAPLRNTVVWRNKFDIDDM